MESVSDETLKAQRQLRGVTQVHRIWCDGENLAEEASLLEKPQSSGFIGKYRWPPLNPVAFIRVIWQLVAPILVGRLAQTGPMQSAVEAKRMPALVRSQNLFHQGSKQKIATKLQISINLHPDEVCRKIVEAVFCGRKVNECFAKRTQGKICRQDSARSSGCWAGCVPDRLRRATSARVGSSFRRIWKNRCR